MMTMPKVGDVVTIGPNVIKVLEVGDRRVTRVRLTVKRDPVEEK
jgi:CBS domain containing-hemolysin-like protein